MFCLAMRRDDLRAHRAARPALRGRHARGRRLLAARARRPATGSSAPRTRSSTTSARPRSASWSRRASTSEILEANKRRFEEKWGGRGSPTSAAPSPRYEACASASAQIVADQLPAEATVLVVSKGDDELLDLGGRRARHFPEAEDGTWAGHHPADSAEAVAPLEAMRAAGGEFILFPSTGLWWLDHYDGLLRAPRAALRHGGARGRRVRHLRSQRTRPMNAPRCTIVIPVHDRAGLTRHCLEAILADPPRTSFEIVVVDDASTDDDAGACSPASRPRSEPCAASENGGFATACNDGAAAARGELPRLPEQRHRARTRAGSTRSSTTRTRTPRPRRWARSCCSPTAPCSTPAS